MTLPLAGRTARTVRRRLAGLSDLQTFALVMAAGAVLLPRVPNPGILCPLRRMTGIPCPLCGSTGAVLALSRGHVWQAVVSNPAAVVLVACCAAAFAPQRWRDPLLARGRAARQRVPAAGRLAMTVLTVLALWAYELHRFGKW
jgi:hypothetical protein